MDNTGKTAKTIIYFASILSLGFVSAIIGPSLPSISKNTGIDLYKMGYLFTSVSIGYLIGAFLSGIAYEKSHGHPLLSSSLFVFSLILIFVSVLKNILIVLLLLLFLGIAEGFLDVGCNTLIVWVHRSKVGPYMNALHFFFGLGALISPLIVGASIKLTGNIKLSFWLISGTLLAPTIISLRLQSPPIYKNKNQNGESNKKFFIVALLALFYFFHVGAELSYGGWIYTYSLKLRVINQFSSIYLTSVFWGALTIGRLLGVFISLKLKSSRILLIDITGWIIASLLLNLYPRSGFFLWMGTILMGLSIASLFPTGLNFAEEKMHISSYVTSWILVGSSLGSMFFPWLIGYLFEKVGLRIFPLIMLIISISDFIVLIIVQLQGIKKEQSKSVEQA